MVAPALKSFTSTAHIEPLSAADAAEMVALATLTQPGPFRIRTHELGAFSGIRHDGRLVAMAGERMKLDGYTEVSGVCTHPDFRGRGYGAALSHAVAARIRDRGETPFLHARAANTAAISLYESLGFKLRRDMTVTVLRRSESANEAARANDNG
jgi:predicted GNAT family acetyltransferase